MPYRRKITHTGNKHLKKGWRVRRRTKDLDQIDEDLQPQNTEKLLNQEQDLDKPGFAQFYCVHCAKYFIDNRTLNEHFRTKGHKRRLKALEVEPYTLEESLRAAGFGSYKEPTKRKIESQPVKEEETEPSSSKRMKTDD